jgi:predicted Ser/Thr protein kinase
MEEASRSLDHGKPKATIGELIGHGGYGYIYPGTWDDGKSIVKAAFKTIPIKNNFEEEKQFLENNRLDHMFVVKYLGTTTENSIE